jgi:hypothetical protein
VFPGLPGGADEACSTVRKRKGRRMGRVSVRLDRPFRAFLAFRMREQVEESAPERKCTHRHGFTA